jgi:hypothetical protein
LPYDFSDDGVDRMLFISELSKWLPPTLRPPTAPWLIPKRPLELTNDLSAPLSLPRYDEPDLSVPLPSFLLRPKVAPAAYPGFESPI